MIWFQRFYLDKEKDIIVDLYKEGDDLSYTLRTPNHNTGNLITNLAKLCLLPLSFDGNGLKIICGQVPCYIDGYNRRVYIFRLGNTKVANIYPDGTVEMKAQIPSISKTLMSQTKDYRLGEKKTIVKTYIRSECKFRTDLHTHMNANLPPDILIALGIAHEIRYPLYYIKKLGLRLSAAQERKITERRKITEEKYKDYALTGKYMTRRIDDNTFLNFADLILKNPQEAAYNIAKIRNSLAIMKDGQAVFTNLEKVYLYRYVFTKGVPDEDPIGVSDAGAHHPAGISWQNHAGAYAEERPDIGAAQAMSAFRAMSAVRMIPDEDIRRTVLQILRDRENPAYRDNTIFRDKLLWIARGYAAAGISYAEITDTTLVKKEGAAQMLSDVHAVMPAVTAETGVTLRFLAGIRRIPLTIIKHKAQAADYFRENLQVLRAVASDPYIAGSDIIGEEINDILDLKPVIGEIVKIAAETPGFVIRIHAGENDSLRDNVANSVRCVRESLAPGQPMPEIRIGHGLYTANLRTAKGKAMIRELTESGAVLEFQISSNVRLNNLSAMEKHPLRQYLHAGVRCVQGTDGGALYGTDSIDEQLSLEKMLGLKFEELCRMRECEEEIRLKSMHIFREKARNFRSEDDVTAFYNEKIENETGMGGAMLPADRRKNAAAALADRIEEMPQDCYPVVVCGGSFNNDARSTGVRESGKRVIDRLLRECDPDRHVFVIGHRLSGYEKYLVDQNRGRFRIYAFVPALLSGAGIRKIRESGVKVRIAIEAEAMGTYKSIAYEVFKRRKSTLIALDGNSAGANLIQEAKNAKYRCRIFISAHSRTLRNKAESLEGYVTIFRDNEEIHAIPDDLE